MAQIFVSHSRKDTEIIHFLLESFAGTKVKPHLEELERETPSGVTAQKIEWDIQSSNAVFVVLSENVEKLSHTRDWINWECGSAKNKEVWVFEPFESLGDIGVVVPRFNHYVLFERTDEWRKYLLSIIDSYDDSHVIPALSAAVGGGALLSEKDRGFGAGVGLALGLGALMLRDKFKPAFGVAVRCWNCCSNYRVHRYGNFRCAVCNASSILYPPELPAFSNGTM
jgi:hypothetical protein